MRGKGKKLSFPRADLGKIGKKLQPQYYSGKDSLEKSSKIQTLRYYKRCKYRAFLKLVIRGRRRIKKRRRRKKEGLKIYYKFRGIFLASYRLVIGLLLAIMAIVIPPFGQDFTYLEQFGLLVCKGCTVAILPNRLYKHGSNQHNRAPAYCIAAVEWARGLRGIVTEEKGLRALQWPAEDSDPIEAIAPAKTGGFRCTAIPACTFIGPSEREVKRHLTRVHGWQNPLGDGRPSRLARDLASQAERPWRGGVNYQRFFTAGPYSRLFEGGAGPEYSRREAYARR